MSYYDNSTNTLVNGTVADATEVEGKFNEVKAGFDEVEVDMNKRLVLSNADNVNREIVENSVDRSDKVIGFDASGVLSLLLYANPTELQGFVDAAEAAALAAAASETAAGISETNASASETAAGISETNASASAASASLSEANADADATTASNAALAASNSASAAAISETNAASSETNASASETAAGISETNAAASETQAGISETNAANSEANAAISETNAASSANLSYQWADNPEDVPVQGGEFSSYHWAQKAAGIVGGPYVLLGGDTMTGLLNLSGDPITSLGAATKQYVDNSSGGGSVTVSVTPPLGASEGDQWYNSANGQSYTWVDGGDDSAYSATVVGLAPLAFYKMNEAALSTTVLDYSGNNYDGAFTSSPTLEVTSIIPSEVDTGMRGNVGWGRVEGVVGTEMNINSNETFSLVIPMKVYNTTSYFQQIGLFKADSGEPLSLFMNQSYPGYGQGLVFGSQTTWGQHDVVLPTAYKAGPDPFLMILTYDGVGTFTAYIQGVATTVNASDPLGLVTNPTKTQIPHHVSAANYDSFVDFGFQGYAQFDYELNATQAADIYQAYSVGGVVPGRWVQNGDKQLISALPSEITWPTNPSITDTFTDGEGTEWECLAEAPDDVIWGRTGNTYVAKTGDTMTGVLVNEKAIEGPMHGRFGGLNLASIEYDGPAVEIFYSVDGYVYSYDRSTSSFGALRLGGEPASLEHGNQAKITTTTTGADVTGVLEVDTAIEGPMHGRFGGWNPADIQYDGPAVEVLHNGTHGYVVAYDRGGAEYEQLIVSGTPVLITYDGVEVMRTISGGVDVTGVLDVSGNITANAAEFDSSVTINRDSTNSLVINKSADTKYSGISWTMNDELMWMMLTANSANRTFSLQSRDPDSSGAFNFTALSIDHSTGAILTHGDVQCGDGGANTRVIIKKADNNVSDHLQFFNATTRIGEIGCEDGTWLRFNQETAKNLYTNRSWYVAGNVVAYYSDERLKDVKEVITGALYSVNQWRAVRYTANEVAGKYGYDTDKVEVGLLTQDIEKDFPELIDDAPCSVDDDTDYKTLNYERVVAVLVSAIQELTDRVEELEEKLR